MQELKKPVVDSTINLSQILLTPSNKTITGEFVAVNSSDKTQPAVCKQSCSGHCSG